MKTPVALLIFNRPDTTEKVFEAIRQAKPPKLLVVADGPRSDRPGEKNKCEAARAIIDRVDWDCQVLTNYSDVNLGCKNRVSSGLDWVFNMVEEAIILEDDCLPHPDFFRFCEELLNYYRNDTRVMHISGCNYGITGSVPDQSYYFSKMVGVWGWATWRRCWDLYDVNISFWTDLVKQKILLRDIFKSPKELKLRMKNWEGVYSKKINSWAYIWHLTCLCNGGISIKPNQNLINNIGFGANGTHTKDQKSVLAKLQTKPMQFPLVHPRFMLRDSLADEIYFNQTYNLGLTQKISKIIKQKLTL